MKIAIFDSGMGGLSVLHQAIKILPDENFIYFADIDNVPYGIKSKEEILNFTDKAVKFLLGQDIKAIVVACNTATSVAIKYLRETYPEIIIIGMEPAVKMAIDNFPNKKSLVIATPITVAGEKMDKLINKYDVNNLINLLALPKLVEFAENEIFEGEEVKEYLKSEFSKFNFNEFSSIVLGCTHFNYFKDVLIEVLPKHIKILDGNLGTINNLKSELEKKNILGEKEQNELEYFYSCRKVKNENELARIDRYLQKLDEVYEK